MVVFKLHDTDIFNTTCEALVIPVNCVGAMGKGVAAQCKARLPDVYEEYKDICGKQILRPGKCIRSTWRGPYKIIYFPTKDHWRDPAKLSWVTLGLEDLVWKNKRLWSLKSIAIPAVGCGNGGLLWITVRALIEDILGHEAIQYEVYEPR